MSLSAPRVPRITAKLPKPFRLVIQPAVKGATVTHLFHGARARTFVFHDPAKMVSHLHRALKSEWLHPDANIATRVDRDINI